MAEDLKLGISRIWTRSWTSLGELTSTTRLYGDLTIRIGERQLEGVTMETRGGAELNVAARELIELRNFPDGDSFTAAFQHIPSAEYEVARHGDSLYIELPKARRAKRAERLECSYSQVLVEIASFAAKLKGLLVEQCPLDACEAWWHLNLSGRLGDF